VLLVVRDEGGQVLRRLAGPKTKGLHRVSWDLRWPPPEPVVLREVASDNPFASAPHGPFVLPGRYSVTVETLVDGRFERLAGPVSFQVKALPGAKFPATDRQALAAFQIEVAELQRAVSGTVRVVDQTDERLALIQKTLLETPAEPELLRQVRVLQRTLDGVRTTLQGDRTLESRQEATLPSIGDRVRRAVSAWSSTSAPTATHRQNVQVAGAQLVRVLDDLRLLLEQDLPVIEKQLDAVGAPWTPGRLPGWPRK
jgi:hypothetical protein